MRLEIRMTTGKALTAATPTMVLRHAGATSTESTMPVAEITGLDGNAAETHYGNDVPMREDSTYNLDVTLNGQTGTFVLTVPGLEQ